MLCCLLHILYVQTAKQQWDIRWFVNIFATGQVPPFLKIAKSHCFVGSEGLWSCSTF